jgi:outer membrane protein assembly factor BamB
MEFESVWTRQLHQQVNPKAFMLDDRDLYTIEKTSYLVKIDVLSGIQKWSVKIPDCWGYLASFGSNLYYLSQNSDLLVIDKITGEVTCNRKINVMLPGYVVPTGTTFITGGWRGYSNLACYDLETLEQMWSKPTQSSKLIKFSIPYLLTDRLLFTANHTTNKIAIIDLRNGETKFELDLPTELDCPDYQRSDRVIDRQITFVTGSGKVFRLSDDFSRLEREDLAVDSILTTLPFLSGREIIFQDKNGCYCLYDLDEKKVRWERKIGHNFTTQVYACKLTQDCYAIAGSLGQIMVVNRDGEKVGSLRSEKRITTPLLKIDDLLIYTNKSEIKVARFHDLGG